MGLHGLLQDSFSFYLCFIDHHVMKKCVWGQWIYISTCSSYWVHWSSGNALGLYSGDTRFECRLRQRFPWLGCSMVFVSPFTTLSSRSLSVHHSTLYSSVTESVVKQTTDVTVLMACTSNIWWRAEITKALIGGFYMTVKRFLWEDQKETYINRLQRADNRRSNFYTQDVKNIYTSRNFRR
jgi:hypothetical protein